MYNTTYNLLSAITPNWGELTIAGVCVTGLLWLLYRIVIMYVESHTSINHTHREDRKAAEDRHREEREEWLKTVSTHQDKIERALDTLAEIIKDRREQK